MMEDFHCKEVERLVLRGVPHNRERMRDVIEVLLQLKNAHQRLALISVLRNANSDVLRLLVQEDGLRAFYKLLMCEYGRSEREDALELRVAILELLDALPKSDHSEVIDAQLLFPIRQLANATCSSSESLEALVAEKANALLLKYATPVKEHRIPRIVDGQSSDVAEFQTERMRKANEERRRKEQEYSVLFARRISPVRSSTQLEALPYRRNRFQSPSLSAQSAFSSKPSKSASSKDFNSSDTHSSNFECSKVSNDAVSTSVSQKLDTVSSPSQLIAPRVDVLQTGAIASENVAGIVKPSEEDIKASTLWTITVDMAAPTEEDIELMEKKLTEMKEIHRSSKRQNGVSERPLSAAVEPRRWTSWIPSFDAESENKVYCERCKSRIGKSKKEEKVETNGDMLSSCKGAIHELVNDAMRPFRGTKFASSSDYRHVVAKLTHTIFEEEKKGRKGKGIKISKSLEEHTRRFVTRYITSLGDKPYCRKRKVNQKNNESTS